MDNRAEKLKTLLIETLTHEDPDFAPAYAADKAKVDVRLDRAAAAVVRAFDILMGK